MQRFLVEFYDVLRDAEGGWNSNCSVYTSRVLEIDAKEVSDTKVERAARALFSFTGRKTEREDFGDSVRWVDPQSAVAVELHYEEIH